MFTFSLFAAKYTLLSPDQKTLYRSPNLTYTLQKKEGLMPVHT